MLDNFQLHELSGYTGLERINYLLEILINSKTYYDYVLNSYEQKDCINYEETNQPPIIVGDNSRLLYEVKYKTQYLHQDAMKEILFTQKELIYDK